MTKPTHASDRIILAKLVLTALKTKMEESGLVVVILIVTVMSDEKCISCSRILTTQLCNTLTGPRVISECDKKQKGKGVCMCLCVCVRARTRTNTYERKSNWEERKRGRKGQVSTKIRERQ